MFGARHFASGFFNVRHFTGPATAVTLFVNPLIASVGMLMNR